ncbi:T9SS type A sorting domain-containing protein [Mesonia sp. HuA40]|uniref:T9SS type A sorting domain-containing protein n=1 Tax=Mesonia sp. HuA40 TaxID=2602761 RepID=UPI0011C8BE36|nr:T9SS type A sorting domain-containing protein [Mesonia sp. HuA40]TXK73568.1 T9SS type A sorting domain-containing protein [Mesonia sp. HuA40]
MKQLSFFFFAFLFSLNIQAQFTTPGSGINYSLSDLVTASPSTISFNGTRYTLSQPLTISANDTLQISTADSLMVAPGIRITVSGSFFTDSASDPVVISAENPQNHFDGLRFEQGAEVAINNTKITYGGGLRVLTEDFAITNSYIAHHISGAATGAAISLSRGAPVIANNTITLNDLPAVASGANQNVPASILNNWIEKNSQSNQNRPQINMGPTGGTQDTLKIIENTIIGDRSLDKVGGIAISNFVNQEIRAIIDNNTVEDNRYGITIAGPNAFAYIRENNINNNDSQNLPNSGGSGISLNSNTNTQNIIARKNTITGNLWGITLLGNASINLGTNQDLGENSFDNNGNNGTIYALYNNTSNNINAIGNCWISSNPNATNTQVEDVIVHQTDDPNLGLVNFSLFGCNLSTPNTEALNIVVYPNPTDGQINFKNDLNFNKLEVYNLMGKKIKSFKLSQSENNIHLGLSEGLYLIKFIGIQQQYTKKLMIN